MINKIDILREILQKTEYEIIGHDEQVIHGNLDEHDLSIVEASKEKLILKKQIIMDQINVLSE